MTLTSHITTPYYGEMYDAAGAAWDMVEDSVWHAASFIDTTGIVNGWTFTAGENQAITAQADGGGGEVTHTSAGHGLAAGDIVTIANTTNYNGIFEVQSVSGNDFNVTDAWAGDDAQGSYFRGGTLTAGASAAGIYSALCMLTADFGGGEKFQLELLQNTTRVTKTLQSIQDASGANVEPGVTVAGLLDISVGDKVSLVVQATLATSLRVTPRGCNFMLTRI